MPTTKAEDLPEDSPLALQMMAAVIGKQEVDDEYYKGFAAWLARDPEGFAKRHSSLEEKMWAAKKPVTGTGQASADWDGTGTCPVCGRAKEVAIDSKAAREVADEWLRKHS